MTIVVLVGALLLLGIAISAVAWPLFREGRGGSEAALAAEMQSMADPLVELQEQRDSIYQAIKELRFDFQVGKVSEADYKGFDTQLRSQAVLVLKQIDALKKAEADPELDAAVEAEIAALRQVNGSDPARPAPVVALAGAAAVSFCPQCGTKAKPGDQFCGKCGTALG